jgi:hypothetical protein
MKQQKPGRAGVGAGEVFVEITEKKQFPGFRFSGGWKLPLGRGKRRPRERNCISEDQDSGVSGILNPIQEAKMEILAKRHGCRTIG